MSTRPTMRGWNLVVRFGLELVSVAGIAVCGWRLWHPVVGIAAAVAAAVSWGTFAVPDDPSRSGDAPVPVPGVLRLLLELAVLVGGAVAWALADFVWVAFVLGGVLVVHHLVAMPRMRWLVGQ